MTTAKLPFKLETLQADRHFIPVYPENKEWLIVLKGTELGETLCNLLEPDGIQKDRFGLNLDKIYGLYQEERQLLEKQIEDYRNEFLSYQKFLATVAKALDKNHEETASLLDAPYKEGLETGEKVEPFLPRFREITKNLNRLQGRLDENAIAVVMSKRFGVKWTKEEAEMLHEGMKKALSDFINREQRGWAEEEITSDEVLETDDDLEGEDIQNPTGLESTTT